MSAEDPPPSSPGRRRALTALGIVALAAAIFLEQWCYHEKHANDPMPPSFVAPPGGSDAMP